MKKMMTIAMLATMTITQAMAAGEIKGSVLLNGKKMAVSIDTNINTGRAVVLDGKKFDIQRINATEILAKNGQDDVNVFLGETLKDGILPQSAKDIADYFQLLNAKELNCKNKSAKAFVVLSQAGGSVGNCVY